MCKIVALRPVMVRKNLFSFSTVACLVLILPKKSLKFNEMKLYQFDTIKYKR